GSGGVGVGVNSGGERGGCRCGGEGCKRASAGVPAYLRLAGKRRVSSLPGRLYLVQPLAAGRQLIGFGWEARRDEPSSGWENLVARDQARPACTPLVAR